MGPEGGRTGSAGLSVHAAPAPLSSDGSPRPPSPRHHLSAPQAPPPTRGGLTPRCAPFIPVGVPELFVFPEQSLCVPIPPWPQGQCASSRGKDSLTLNCWDTSLRPQMPVVGL